MINHVRTSLNLTEEAKRETESKIGHRGIVFGILLYLGVDVVIAENK